MKKTVPVHIRNYKIKPSREIGVPSWEWPDGIALYCPSCDQYFWSEEFKIGDPGGVMLYKDKVLVSAVCPTAISHPEYMHKERGNYITKSLSKEAWNTILERNK